MIKRKFRSATLGLLLPSLLAGGSACSLINDDTGPCSPSYLVRFIYERNMKFTDAFPQEVESVHLYVLDAAGNVVYDQRERGDALKAAGYTMTIPVDPGNYRLLAWCSTNDGNSYTLNAEPSGYSSEGSKADAWLACRINATADATAATGKAASFLTPDSVSVSHDLDPLYHGILTDAELPNDASTHTLTVPLTKNTNRIRILLQHLSGEALDVDDFTFEIVADNGLMLLDNSVVSGNPVSYAPHHTSSGDTELDGIDGGVLSVAMAEFTVGRLVTTDSPRLIVRERASDDVIISVPINDYILMVKGYEWADMDSQEYLDREENYNFTFFLDERDRWLDAYVYINSWRIVLHPSSL